MQAVGPLAAGSQRKADPCGRAQGVEIDALLREIERGETLYAEKVRPGEPKIMTHRGGDIL